MIAIGILIAILGFFLNFYALEAIGVVIAVVGLILWFVPVGGRTRRWY
jgi:hypothetical protein